MNTALLMDGVLSSSTCCPRTPAGDTHVASVDECTSASTTDEDPNRHPVTPDTKPSPDSVTTLPPDTPPDDGHTECTSDAPMYSTCTPLWLSSPPALTETSTTRIPSPRAGSTQRASDPESTLALLDDHTSPPTPQYTPDDPDASAMNPDPVSTTSVPPTDETTTGSTELTFMAPTSSIDAALVLHSCPFTDTWTEV